jgi:hypothetical protein
VTFFLLENCFCSLLLALSLTLYLAFSLSLTHTRTLFSPHPSSVLQSDLNALTTEQIDYEADSKSAGGLSMSSATTDEIITDVHRYCTGVQGHGSIE